MIGSNFATEDWGIKSIFFALWTVTVIVAVVIFMRGCEKEPEPGPIVIAPDGGARALAIEERLDAAVVTHAEEVRVIERTVVVQRIEYERAATAEENAVRAQGRDALAAWLETFAVTVGPPIDAGPTDYVDPTEGP